MTMPVTEVLGLLKTLDEVFDLRGALLQAARQAEPRLNLTPLPDEGAAMAAARRRANDENDEG